MMKKARMLRDEDCGLKKGDIVDIVEKDEFKKKLLIYKKGIDGHVGPFTYPEVCQDHECLWVKEDDIEIIDEKEEEKKTQEVDYKSEYNNLLNKQHKKNITIRALIEYIMKLEG